MTHLIRRWRRHSKANEGFSMAELAFTLLLVALLVGIGVPTWLGIRERGQDADAQSTVEHSLLNARATQLGADGWYPALSADLAAGLNVAEPTYAFVVDAVVPGGPDEVSVLSHTNALSEPEVLLVTRSASSRCYAVRDNAVVGVHHTDWVESGTEPCTATHAATRDSGWVRSVSPGGGASGGDADPDASDPSGGDTADPGDNSGGGVVLPPLEPPGTPAAPTISGVGDGSVTVAWAAPASGGTPDAYTVTAAPGGATCTAATPELTCAVSGLVNGTGYTFTLVATNTAGDSATSATSAPAVPSAPEATFAFTGSTQTWTVPAGVTEVTVTARGASGGSGRWQYYGTTTQGRGAIVTATIPVTPGQTMWVNVGGQGLSNTQWGGTGWNRGGGWNGGGNTGPGRSGSTSYAGGGGGATDIRLLGTSTSHRVVVAGAGGGGGAGRLTGYGMATSNSRGGDAGVLGATASAGTPGNLTPPYSTPVRGGNGGTQFTGGTGGSGMYGLNGHNGSAGVGGGVRIIGETYYNPGGGGGGGYYGGGGGGSGNSAGANGGGGGGGSSWVVPTATNTSSSVAPSTGHGSVLITWN